MATFHDNVAEPGTLRLSNPAEEHPVVVIDLWASENGGLVDDWGGKVLADTITGIEMRMGETAELETGAGTSRILLTGCRVGEVEFEFRGAGPPPLSG